MPRIVDAVKRLSLGDALVRRNPVFYSRTRKTFARLSSAPLPERQQFSERRLRAVLHSARKTEYGAELQACRDIADWPLLAKERVRDDWSAFARRTRFALPAATGGTTGVPVTVVRSFRSVSVEQAAIDHIVALAGCDLRTARTAVLRADSVSTPEADTFWRDAGGGRRRMFSARHLSSATLDAFRQGLASFAPECLFAYPSSLESLCLLLRERDLKAHVPVVLTSSEVLPSSTRELAEQTLGATVIDLYGQAERVTASYSLRDGEHRFLPGYGHVELVPEGEVDGMDTYEVVATSLWNLAMPLVRYRTGDLVALPAGADAETLERVRYGLEPFIRVIGRTNDYLVAPDGSRIIGMNHIPRGVANVYRMQLIQETTDFVRVLVLAKGGFGAPDRDQIAKNLAAKLAPTMRFEIEAVEKLERAANGRVPHLILRPGVMPPGR